MGAQRDWYYIAEQPATAPHFAIQKDVLPSCGQKFSFALILEQRFSRESLFRVEISFALSSLCCETVPTVNISLFRQRTFLPLTFLCSERAILNVVHPEYSRCNGPQRARHRLQGYLTHKKTPTPLGPPWHPRHRPMVGSQEGGLFFYLRYPCRLSQ